MASFISKDDEVGQVAHLLETVGGDARFAEDHRAGRKQQRGHAGGGCGREAMARDKLPQQITGSRRTGFDRASLQVPVDVGGQSARRAVPLRRVLAQGLENDGVEIRAAGLRLGRLLPAHDLQDLIQRFPSELVGTAAGE